MIIARTYLYSLMGRRGSIPESAIDADIMTEKEMRKAWGKESFLDCCQTFADAARETRGTVAAFEGTANCPAVSQNQCGENKKGGRPGIPTWLLLTAEGMWRQRGI